jgi:hypothetical protein
MDWSWTEVIVEGKRVLQLLRDDTQTDTRREPPDLQWYQSAGYPSPPQLIMEFERSFD